MGVMVYRELIDNALVCCDIYEDKFEEELKKETVEMLMENATGDVKIVLETRQTVSKISLKKYEAMDNGVCKDGRMKGILQFHGASIRGRWARRQIQLHNLPRNTMDTLQEIR